MGDTFLSAANGQSTYLVNITSVVVVVVDVVLVLDASLIYFWGTLLV